MLARRGPVVAVVEVRTRGTGSYLSAFASIDAGKRKRLRAAAETLWKRFRDDPTIDRIRVDVAAVDLETTPIAIEIAEAIG